MSNHIIKTMVHYLLHFLSNKHTGADLRLGGRGAIKKFELLIKLQQIWKFSWKRKENSGKVKEFRDSELRRRFGDWKSEKRKSCLLISGWSQAYSHSHSIKAVHSFIFRNIFFSLIDWSTSYRIVVEIKLVYLYTKWQKLLKMILVSYFHFINRRKRVIVKWGKLLTREQPTCTSTTKLFLVSLGYFSF